MWSAAVDFVGTISDRIMGALLGTQARIIEFFLIWQYGKQVEGQRRTRLRHLRQQQQPAARNSQSTDSSRTSHSDDGEVDHRQAVAGLTLLGQRVPNLMGGYYRQKLQSVYGRPFSMLAEVKRRREQITEDVWLYRLNVRTSPTTRSVEGTTESATASHSGPHTKNAHAQPSESDDIPLLVWLVMPWECEASVTLRFVFRLAYSLSCDALLVTVPMDDTSGPSETVKLLFDAIEAGKRKTHARRILIGGNELAAMFVLLLLERRCPLLQVGAYAAADPEVARSAFCQGVILVDPFVGWETSVPPRPTTTGRSSSRGNTGYFESRGRPPPNAGDVLSAKDRFKQVVLSSSGGCIQQWFPSPITYEAPPIVVLVDEGGFWLQEQCDFNARVDRCGAEENGERVFFLPYTIERAAAGTLVSLSCKMEIERLCRMVEKFLGERLQRKEPSAASTSSGDCQQLRRDDGEVRSRLSEGEATFLAGFVA
ncbi:hypothetical protein C3747_57g131 [Trypanosoma cruzi]|uniref:Uncharacterized protein n=2 Tax=Trypanosoma cruzi TaxID=5693 RepID=Q4DDI6_TRYCC|nr:hypothetical protein, conserved [Trypanosoma cruzi]EAN90593.1 hypothetical protein, conserved [Trypanosoma cruzi]KAF8291303.1 hypothetical protein TcYC6_0127020 [Trypanosoma cruzi]PWV11753.1 hypothetical protein C3747_57g131 [Trypanosoma cruzi]RNC57422.1 hypothetical protein TcCL_ESM04979 [Trypanosoma cruzi]|eukprot:XP_812444.1 hypothetical protein [Trypanosoma cruzi strain CL Brener]